MKNTFLGLPIPKSNDIGVRIVKGGSNSIRVQISMDWFEFLEKSDRDRLAIGFCHELPGHLLIATARDCHCRGYKAIFYKNKNVTITLRTDPNLVERLLPGPLRTKFIPNRVILHVKSTGERAIALEWPGSIEYLRSHNAPVDDVNEPSDAASERVQEVGTLRELTVEAKHSHPEEYASALSCGEFTSLNKRTDADDQIVEPSSDRASEDNSAHVKGLSEFEAIAANPEELVI